MRDSAPRVGPLATVNLLVSHVPQFTLKPTKVVFNVPAQDEHAAETVVVHRHNLLYSVDGNEIAIVQQLVELVLQQDKASELFRDGQKKHKFFRVEWRFAGTILENRLYLKKLPHLLRPIESVRITGKYELNTVTHSISSGRQSGGKVVWVTGKRRTESIRFGLRCPTTGLCSHLWTCFTEKGRAKSDVYIVPSTLGNIFKISLHESGSWQLGFTREYAETLSELRTRTGSRHWEIWERPDQLSRAVTRAFAVVLPASLARHTPNDDATDDNVCWVSPPSDGFAMEFNVVITHPVPRDDWPGRRAMNTQLTGSFELESGEILWIVHREIPLPKPEPVTLSRDAIKKIMEGSGGEKLTIMLIGKSDDGSRYALEVPLDVESIRQKFQTGGGPEGSQVGIVG
jgi:hypothetical protein